VISMEKKKGRAGGREKIKQGAENGGPLRVGAAKSTEWRRLLEGGKKNVSTHCQYKALRAKWRQLFEDLPMIGAFLS